MSILDYIEELKMFMIDPRYEKLQSIINNILKLNVDNETIVKLYNDVIYLKDHMDDYDNKIEALQGQIDKLKKENGELRKEIIELRKENSELKNHIKEQDKKIIKLEQELVELKKENAELKAEKVVSHIVTSLQDLNSSDSLEIILSEPLNDMFYDLRYGRNYMCHYMRLEGRTKDSEDVLKYKKLVLYQVLTNISEDVKKNFEDLYGEGLIEGAIEYLKDVIDVNVQVTEKEQRKVKAWWGFSLY